MEFLDPEEKRAKTRRIFSGYALAIVAVVSITTVLSFVLQGADLFSRQIDVKNGLLFVDSKPVSADVYIDGQIKKRTEARFVLPEDKYDLKLSQAGYRDWTKRVDVIGSKVRYHVYPKLIPNDVRTVSKNNYSDLPYIYTQSADRKWLIVSINKTQPVMHKYDLGNQDSVPTTITVPSSVISAEDAKSATFKEIEWASDSKNVLYKKTLGSKIEYILINIDKPDESVNISAKFKLNSSYELTLLDRKYDKYYVLNTATKTLQRANLKDGIQPQVVADGVVDYKYYGSDIVLYATVNGAEDGYYSVRISKDNSTYNLEPIVKSDDISLDVASYENDWYYAVGSDKQEYVGIYLNPIATQSVSNGFLKPQLKLRISAPKMVSFSDNARFIAAQSESDFAVYDAEVKRVYRYKSPIKLPVGGAKWMDGHRLRAAADGKEQIFEYDGNNLQATSAALDGSMTYYDRDYLFSYSFVKDEAGPFKLIQANLVAEAN